MTLPLVISPGDAGHIDDHEEIHALLDDVASPFTIASDAQDVLANRPAAGDAGRWYFASDVPALYRDDGTTWRQLLAATQANSFTAPQNFEDDAFFGSGQPWVDVRSDLFGSGGAVGDGAADDRPAFEDAFAALVALPASGGITYAGPGTYSLSSAGSWCIDVPSGVQLVGAGATTVLQAAAGIAAFVEVVAIQAGVEHAAVRDLTVDGNKANAGASTDDRHGIRLEGVVDVLIENVRMIETDGDGLYIGHTTRSSQVTVQRCHFAGNARNGITVGGCTEVRIIGNYFAADIEATAIDGEAPNDTAVATYVEVAGNLVEPNDQFAITTTGNSATGLNAHWDIHHNTLRGGSIDVSFSSDVSIHHNDIVGANLATTAAIQVGRTVTGIYICDNKRVESPTWRGVYVFSTGTTFASDVRITGNRNVIAAAGFDGVRCQSVNEGLTVSDNDLTGHGGVAGAGVYIQATLGNMRNVHVQNNTARNFVEGTVRLTRSASWRLVTVTVTGNHADDTQGSATMLWCLNFAGVDFIDGLYMAGNSASSTVAKLASYYNALVFRCGGNGRVEHSGTMADASDAEFSFAAATPNGLITASPGAMARSRLGGALTTLWLKESGANSNTGWVAK